MTPLSGPERVMVFYRCSLYVCIESKRDYKKQFAIEFHR